MRATMSYLLESMTQVPKQPDDKILPKNITGEMNILECSVLFFRLLLKRRARYSYSLHPKSNQLTMIFCAI